MKNPPANAGDTGSISGSGRFLREGNGNSLQYSCQGKSHGQKSLAGHSPWGHKSRTGLRDKSNYIYIYINQILMVTANQNLLYTHTKEKGIQTSNNEQNGNKNIHIDNYLKCKWIKCPNQKT